MPNHIHGILVLDGDEKNDIPLHSTDSVQITDSVETTHALSLQQQQQSEKQPDEIMQSLQTIEYEQWNLSKKTPGQKRFQHQGAHTVSSIIGSYKSAATKHAHRLGYDFEWQDRFHDHIIRNDAEYRRIAHYIETNVENWETDCFFGEE